MSSNAALIPAKDYGWLNGFQNLFRKENRQWWRTWQWLVQMAIWMAVVNGMLAMVLLTAPKIEAAQARAELRAEEAIIAEQAIAQTGLMVFFVFSALAPAVGVVIIAQDALIGEKATGTAAWVLSKPVSRIAFLLSKLSADALGVLACMVIAQGLAAYFIYKVGTGITLPVPNCLAALGLLYLLLLFYLALTYMLGSLFRSRGPVIGLPLLLVFGHQLAGPIPWLSEVMPWNMLLDMGPDRPSLAVALISGQPLPTVAPIIGTAVLIIFFTAVALWRFQREEF